MSKAFCADEAAPTLISLRGIRELHGVRLAKAPQGDSTSHEHSVTQIGALTTIAGILSHESLGQAYPVLRQAARPFASAQVRNLASLGGNLCNASPAADMAPALLALGARVVLVGESGEREMSLRDFFVGPGKTRLEDHEILTAVHIDAPEAGECSAFLRKGRVSMDLALVSIAVRVAMDHGLCQGVRIAAGAVAPTPIRLPAAEAVLDGHAPDVERITKARIAVEREVNPINDVRASADYRRRLTGVLFARAMATALEMGGSP